MGGATAWISDDFDVNGFDHENRCYCGLEGMQRQPRLSGVSMYGMATQSRLVIRKK
jgi:hypothetical protein